MLRLRGDEDASAVYDEKQVLRRIQQGDRCAFEDYSIIMNARLSPDPPLRQLRPGCGGYHPEIFLAFTEHRHFKGHSSLSTWVYRVAVNHCLEYRRRKRPDSVPYEEDLGLAVTNWRDDPSGRRTWRNLPPR